ncbi:MAG: hypothetical protein MN733_29530 [Nitrososphaera sp.]|nr:hypothetical protein [Nitrososphaera sp.]
MLAKLNSIITWSLLHKVQKVKFVKGMYIWLFLVPIAANALAKINDKVATLSVFGYTFDIQLSLPFSWPLFYFSALCFVLGNVFFYMYCPRLVTEHGNFAEFVGKGKNIQQLYEYTSDIELNWSAIRTEVGIDDVTPIADKEKAFQDMFWCAYKKANLYLTSARIATGCFYLAATILILWVLFQNTDIVVGSLVKRI